jgi:hypothetical protein
MDDPAISALRTAFETANWRAGIAALIVAAGVFIELIILFIFSKEISTAEKRSLVFATALIVLGVLGEWWYGGEAATASENLQSDAATKAANAIRDAAHAEERAASLEKEAADIRERAAKAETETANLMKENVELERVIAPRTIDQLNLVRAVSALPRVPIFISPLDQEEPKEIAEYLVSAFSRLKVGDAPTWSVIHLPSEHWYPEGITVQYVNAFPHSTDNSSEQIAVAICENLRSQEIMARMESFFSHGTIFKTEWPALAPNNAVIIRVGVKPNHFWENKLLRRQGLSEIPEMSFCTAEEGFEWARRQRQMEQQSQKPQK